MSDTQENFDFERLVRMDNESYEILLTKLKVSLVCDIKESSSNYFNNVILACKACIDQCLCVAMNCIDSMNCNYLLSCLEDAGCLLQMLSDFIRKVLESIPFVCSNMKQYPTATGSIILSVFDHCKTSECAYGECLNKVQRQLKELFRACHELQLTYLMTLEKHFTFDLSQAEELHVLLEALDLNLKIGEVVQNLDIKTMAEQWKAYTVLCDKYCKYVEDGHMYRKCTDMLSEMIKSNLKVALEMKSDGGDKAVVRTVKVASFGIKILTKVCNIFKKATHDNDEIIDLLIFLNTHNRSYMQTFLEKPSKVMNLIEDNIRGPLEALLTTVLANHAFINHICTVNEHKLENEKYFGYTILIANSMKILLNNIEVPGEIKLNVISRIFHLLPNGHTWFNVGLKVETNNKTFGLFEYVLTVCSAFARTLSDDQYEALERVLLTSLLGTECYRALFAADLWILLMRSSDSKLVVETTLSLLKVYQSLARKVVFQQSPQKVYLSYVIRNLFRLCTKQEKFTILNTYKIEDFFDLWSGVELTEIVGRQQNVCSLFTTMLKGCLNSHEIENMLAKANPVMSKKPTDQISETLLALWNESRSCECSKVWECKWLERLTALTEAFLHVLPKQTIGKIHNTIGEILKSGDINIVSILFQKYCLFYEKGIVTQNSLEEDVFVKLLNSNDEISQHVFHTIERFEKTAKVIQGNQSLLHLFAEYNYNRTLHLKTKLTSVENDRFSHKCLLDGPSSESKAQSNFDLNIHSLLDDAEEPSSKKLKLNDGECVELISSLEANVRRLNKLKDELSDEQKVKLSKVFSKLQNIIEC